MALAADDERRLRPATATYSFDPGGLYNIDGSLLMTVGRFPMGAHSDIARPEVAHLFWSAVHAGMRS